MKKFDLISYTIFLILVATISYWGLLYRSDIIPIQVLCIGCFILSMLGLTMLLFIATTPNKDKTK